MANEERRASASADLKADIQQAQLEGSIEYAVGEELIGVVDELEAVAASTADTIARCARDVEQK